MSQSPAGRRPRSAPLIPARLAPWFDDHPTLWYENDKLYLNLRKELLTDLVPRDVIERILVKDLADNIWEAGRLRRLRKAAVEAHLPRIAREQMAPYSAYLAEELEAEDEDDAMRHIEVMVEEMLAGDMTAKDRFLRFCDALSITDIMLNHLAHARAADTLARLDAELEQIEHRRDRVLRDMMARRAQLAVMSRSLIARREAEDVVDLNGTDPADAAT